MSTCTDTKIREIVCEILEIDESELTATSHFFDDHGADSLASIEILASLEKEFGVQIPQSELPNMVTVTRLEELVTQFQGE